MIKRNRIALGKKNNRRLCFWKNLKSPYILVNVQFSALLLDKRAKTEAFLVRFF